MPFVDVIEALNKQGVNILRYSDPGIDDDLLLATNSEVVVECEDPAKWDYLVRKVSCQGIPVKGVALSAKEYSIVVPGGHDEVAAKTCKQLTEAIRRQFFKVNPKHDVFSVLVKPTHKCNLDCKYCYDKPYRDRFGNAVLSLETLDRFLDMLSKYAERVQFIWHGGEPTMAGKQWFHEVYKEVFPKYPMVDWDFSLMSNGVALDEEWFNLFKTYNIEPGMSYNAFYQDQLRVSSQTHQNPEKDAVLMKKLEENLMLSKEMGAPVGVIDVITAVNYKHQIDIYEYYKKLGINAAMNPIFHTAQTEKNELEISAEAYAEEYLKYFQHWLYDPDGVRERSAVEMLSLVSGLCETTCTFKDCRYGWLALGPTGIFYPCDRYLDDRYTMGSVYDINSIDEVWEHPGYKLYVSETAKRFNTHCKECGYWFACHGGCNASAFESAGSVSGIEPFFCESFRLKYKGVYEILRDVDMVRDWSLNPVARDHLIKAGFYSVKEIKEIAEEIGVDTSWITYDPDDLLNCSEFQIFRGINYSRLEHQEITRHIDFIQDKTEEAIEHNLEKRREALKSFLKEVARRAI